VNDENFPVLLVVCAIGIVLTAGLFGMTKFGELNEKEKYNELCEKGHPIIIKNKVYRCVEQKS
jgi:cbb3-type cytochrome oxidase cytochrome c subunit